MGSWERSFPMAPPWRPACRSCQTMVDYEELGGLVRRQHWQGSHPGGGKRGPLQEKKSSESVRAAGRPGPADPVATTFLYTIWQRDQVVFWIYYQSKSRPTENYPLCHAGLSYRRCFPYSDRNSHCYSFLSPTFELASFPHLHSAILLLFYPFLAWVGKHRRFQSAGPGQLFRASGSFEAARRRISARLQSICGLLRSRPSSPVPESFSFIQQQCRICRFCRRRVTCVIEKARCVTELLPMGNLDH